MIKIVTAGEVLASARMSLGLPPQVHPKTEIDEEFIAATLRRISGFMCPCSSATLKMAFFDATDGLLEDDEAQRKKVDQVLEDLQMGGDLLELSRVTTADEGAKSTWLFCAPPSFVLRQINVAHIFGVSEEETLPLPNSLASRVVHQGAKRILRGLPNEDLRGILTSKGLIERSIESWLRIPASVSPSQFIRSIDDLLKKAARCTPNLAIKVLLTDSRGRRYWQDVGPSTIAGNYVCRRPQLYGADLWGYVEIDAGIPKRLVDLPLPKNENRGCDDGWQVQLARDHMRGEPQRYAVAEVENGFQIDVFTPIPMWARRRLDHTGDLIRPANGMFSYKFDRASLGDETAFLEQSVWLAKRE